ncbi:MAG TPA: maleylpyruvate isomerase family mycothiol-dependent enzyme, partial [Streptosporangiaceae bacterium]|nr:maleylpyruvate isomerase family mycothiol-dependent enzyme [Streptosporangiaceae bacterium]
LDAAQWRQPVLRDLDVQGLVGHLTGVEEDMQRGLDGDSEVAQADHVASTQPAALRQAGRDPAQTQAEWAQAAQRTLARVGDVTDPDVVLPVYALPLPLSMWLVVRAFELWTHENDIRRAVGLPASVPDPATLRLMTDLVAGVLPLAGAVTGLDQPISLRLVLTGPGGGTWNVRFGQPDQEPVPMRIVTDAIAFCRLAANRAAPADLDLDLAGDPEQAGLVLAAATTLGLD